MSGLRNLLNWKQPVICACVHGQYRLHTGGAARENCTSMAPQMRLMQVHSGALAERAAWMTGRGRLLPVREAEYQNSL